MTATPSDIYPFATQDGKAIPLDILKPSYLFHVALTAESTPISLPEGAVVAMFLADQAALVSFGEPVSAVTSAWSQEHCLYIPKDGIVSSALISTSVHVKAVGTLGSLWIQIIEQWAGLALAKQYVRK